MSEMLRKAREYEEKMISAVPSEQRPVFHLSSPTGWMNDPNGFSIFQHAYHLFFQYHPYDNAWGPMHWGHAVSEDLITWEYLPAAMAPDEPYDKNGVFSGCAIEKDGKLYLMYTGVSQVVLEDGTVEERQNQCLASGDGKDFVKDQNNPVLCSDLLPQGGSKIDFRDPKVWKEDGLYYAAVANRHQDGSGQILLFSSEDLRKWNYCAVLDRCCNQYGKMWECPDFFVLEGKQVLIVSPQDMLADGLEFHNGYGTLFSVGSYRKEDYQFTRERIQAIDYGLDYYAPQTILTEDGRRVMIGWMKSWDNNLMYPEGASWNGMMAVPRELYMRGNRICQRPVRELEAYRGKKTAYQDVTVTGSCTLEGITGRTLDLTVEVTSVDYQEFQIRVAEDEKFYTAITYRPAAGILTFDRTYSGFCRDVATARSIYAGDGSGKIRLRILMDRYSVEIFVNDGEQVLTSLVLTRQEARNIRFLSEGTVAMSVEMWELTGTRKR